MSVTVHNGDPLFLINYATQIISFIAVTSFVFLRIFARWKLQHTLGIDDGMFVACLISILVHLLTTKLLVLWDGYGSPNGNHPSSNPLTSWVFPPAFIHGLLFKCFNM